ncbi:MAG: phage holin family protein [Bacillota bacterium]
MHRQVRKWLASVGGLALVPLLLPAVETSRPETVLLAGTVLWLLGLVVKPILMLLALPVNLLTLGLFILVINTWMVVLADRLIPGLAVPGFWNAFLTALIISGIGLVLRIFAGE